MSYNDALFYIEKVHKNTFRFADYKTTALSFKTLNGNKQRNLPDLSMSGRQYNCDTGTITNRAALRLLIVQHDDY